MVKKQIDSEEIRIKNSQKFAQLKRLCDFVLYDEEDKFHWYLDKLYELHYFRDTPIIRKETVKDCAKRSASVRCTAKACPSSKRFS